MNITDTEKSIRDLSPEEQIKKLAGIFPGEVIFTTSFGLEDQVLTHMIFTGNLNVEVATLDTGRLFPETYQVFNETLKKYGKTIKTYFPDSESVEKMVTAKGPFSFYYSTENRQECCKIRKSVPLSRALDGKKCWISGIRAEQSENRSRMNPVEYDPATGTIKCYPLFGWTFAEVNDFIKAREIPYNVLHDRGFVSIGCQPCTRAVAPGENFRAGRWWWESESKKECGIHSKS